MNNDNLLTLEGVKKHFVMGGGFLHGEPSSLRAVDGVDLGVKRGETFGLVGESGCGKTTLGRCILRLEEPTEGRVLFEGRDIMGYGRRELRMLRRDMQIIFQDPYSSLNPRKKVRRIIGEAFAVHKMLTKGERRDRVQELANLVGIRPEQIDRFPHEFSGGQRQRICVARALALNPKLIIADEAHVIGKPSARTRRISRYARIVLADLGQPRAHQKHAGHDCKRHPCPYPHHPLLGSPFPRDLHAAKALGERPADQFR